MCVHQAVPAVQSETPERWREAIRERWRMTLLSAWEQDGSAENGVVAACARKAVFVRQKPRMLRGNTRCKWPA